MRAPADSAGCPQGTALLHGLHQGDNEDQHWQRRGSPRAGQAGCNRRSYLPAGLNSGRLSALPCPAAPAADLPIHPAPSVPPSPLPRPAPGLLLNCPTQTDGQFFYSGEWGGVG